MIFFIRLFWQQTKKQSTESVCFFLNLLNDGGHSLYRSVVVVVMIVDSVFAKFDNVFEEI